MNAAKQLKAAAAGHAYSLAREIARPVSRGWLSPALADLALTYRAFDQMPPDGNYVHVTVHAQWMMREQWERLESERDLTQYRIERRTRDLIVRKEPSHVVLRDAFDLNAEHGTPFDDGQVRAIVRDAVLRYRAWERRHGG